MARKKKVVTIYRPDAEIPDVFGWRFQTLLVGCGWTPEDGEVQGYFANRQLGHRCLWSAIWSTDSGTYIPDSYGPVEKLTTKALIWEALDVLGRTDRDNLLAWKLSKLVIEHLTGEVVSKDYWRERLEDLLRQMRVKYPEYVGLWDTPSKTKIFTVRPGWGDFKEIQEMRERLRKQEVVV